MAHNGQRSTSRYVEGNVVERGDPGIGVCEADLLEGDGTLDVMVSLPICILKGVMVSVPNHGILDRWLRIKEFVDAHHAC